ncbi:hypothetical protein VTK73DRAFT_2822 [Phialemonium thermophilum]|uniref:O-methyltransferase domain-containing protein n=1 Tax=Phialemonium thermophilum TaxID=223376 RepID=A0ABR3X2U4_9PEZI
MAKFKLSSLLGGRAENEQGDGASQPPPASSTEAQDAKKSKRLSLSAFSGATGRKQTPSKSESSTKSLRAQRETDRTEAAPQPTAMTALAQRIAAATTTLEAYFRDHGLPPPGFGPEDAPDFPKLPDDMQKLRQEIIYATKELRELAIGPRESVRWSVWGHLDVMALQVLNHFGIAKLFPAGETITLSELQKKTPLDPVNLARLLRLAITNKLFAEPSPGVIAHTAASRALAEDEDLQAWVGFNTEDIFPASAHVLQSLKAYPEAVHPTQTGFNFAFGTVNQEPMFATFGKDPVRARRMGRAMASLTGGEGYEVSYLVDVEGGGYDFSAVDEREGTFVDIGGSHGFVCVDLAKRYKKMRFVVQDLPKTVESAPKPISEDSQIAERITLQAHDFFTEQPVKDADVYFFRWIIHNYSTPYATKILRNLVPALKPGARIIINDHCLAEPGSETAHDEGIIRRMDAVMLALLNAQERSEAEFRQLFEAAHPGFVFQGVTRPKGCRMSIIEAVWRPDGQASPPVPPGPSEGQESS